MAASVPAAASYVFERSNNDDLGKDAALSAPAAPIESIDVDIGMGGLKGLLCQESDDPTGLTLPSGLAHHHRKGTESTMSSSPPVEIEESSSSQYTAQGIKLLSASSSPASPLDKKTMLSSRTKGVIASSSVPSSLASAIGKQQGSSQSQPFSGQQTNSATPSLTVTPNSTADGSNFVISPNGMSLQSQLGMGSGGNFSSLEGPTMPYLYTSNNNAFQNNLADGNASTSGSVVHHHHRGESSSFGSFDMGIETTADAGELHEDNDGLFGLDALHYRVSSMHTPDSVASPSSSSPRTTRVVSYNQDSGSLPRRSSAHSVRPPLSYSYADSGSTGSYGNDRSTGSKSVGHANIYESSASGFGTIGQLRLNASEFDPNRRRSSSDFNNPSASVGYQHEQPNLSQKFGTLPTLSSHIHQQQHPPSGTHIDFGDMTKPKHTRSISQPGPPAMGGSAAMGSSVLPPDSRIYGSGSSSYDGKSNAGFPSRSSFTHQTQSGLSFDPSYGSGSKVVGMSMPSSGYSQGNSGYGSSGYSSLEQGFDNFHISPESQSTNSSYTGAYSSEGAYGRNSRVSSSPGHSPHQFFYGNDGSSGNGNLYHHHLRQQSDNGILMSSQSLPVGLNSGLSRVDDDLAHPLAGENIEVPDHDDPHGLLPYLVSSGSSGSHPLLRGATHSHSMSLDAIPTQQFLPSSAPKVVYAVKFKRSQRNFVLGPRISRDLKIGTYVKVEADRGEDLGIVVGKLPPEKFNNSFSSRSSFTAGMGPPPIGSSLVDLKRIMRLATHDEVSLLGLKREEEEELLKICRAKVRQRGLPMNVVDAEYQFDRHKLTFFFEAMGRVDFRELVRDLFSMYKTRIWMQQLDKNTSTSAQAIVFPTANLQMDYGTPIIAPTSEFADSILYGQGGNISSGGDVNRSH